MSEPSISAPLEETVVIIGVGLIGGSLAAALRQRKLARRVIGVGRDAGRLEQARTLGLIDLGLTDLAEAASMADVMVFCTPVDRVAEGVRIAAAHVHPGTLLTDAGSVKQPICEAVADVTGFIGSHPIAGSHRQGMDAANSELFDGRMCVLTPLPSSAATQLQRLDRLWRSVGMRTVQMSASDHDQALAMTSHLPHLVASALAGTLSPQNRLLTGTGFRDSTRIAAGDPELWCGILLQNAEQVCAGIEVMRGRLDSFQSALSAGDVAAIRQLLVEGKQNRDSLENM